jgi:hypothetical protein
MSEPVHTSETPATDAPETPTPPTEPTEPPATDQLGEAGKRAIDRMKAERDEARRTAAANADAAKRLREIEDRDLSELQKAQRDRDELAAKYADLERNALRSTVALAKGLPPEVAAILSGSSEEELTAHADALLAWRGSQSPAAPRPDPSQGPRPTSPELEDDAAYKQFYPDPPTRR